MQNFKINRVFKNGILIYFLFFLICISLPLFFSINGVTDPFSFWHMAFVQKFLPASHFPLEDIVLSPRYIPGAFSMIFLTSKVTAISPEKLQFFPIVGLVLPVTYYALCKKFSDSNISAFIVTLLMLNIPDPTNFFTIWPHAFGFLLYLSFLHIFFNVFENKKPEGIFLLLVIFVSIHFYSYTAEMWALSFFIYISLLLSITFFILKDKSVKDKLLLSLFTSFLVIFFGFNKILYNSYLPEGKFVSTILDSSKFFIYNYANFFALNESNKYIFHPEPNLLLSLSGLIYLALTLFVILIGTVYSLYIILRVKKHNWTVNFLTSNVYFKYSLLGVGLFDLIIYGAKGVITMRYIYFIFPLVVLISLKELPLKKKYRVGVLLILLIFIFSHTVLMIQSDTFISNPTLYRDFEASSSWFMDYSVQNKALIDLFSGNKYLFDSVTRQEYFDKHLISLEQYDMVVNPENYTRKNLSDSAPYLVLNINLKKVNSERWDTFESFSNHRTEINENKNIDKIYDDNIFWIFSTK